MPVACGSSGWSSSANTWRVKYNRHDGTKWLATPIDFPLDGALDPRVESDLFVLFHPTSASQRLWLFWARHEAGGPAGQIALDHRLPDQAGTRPGGGRLVRGAPASEDRRRRSRPRAVALLSAAGNIELFWSSTRSGGWTLWHDTLDIGTLTLGAAQQLTNTPYVEPRTSGGRYRSGHIADVSIEREPGHYQRRIWRHPDTRRAIRRHTTVDTRNAAKLALRGKFEDFQTYTYDAGENGVRN